MLFRAAMLVVFPAVLAAEEAAVERFRAEVEPILRDRCLDCNSHAGGKMKGRLTLDARSGCEQGGDGGPAVVPGNPEASLLMRMVRWEDEDHQMPPDGKLPQGEIAVLERWVREGAVDPRVAEVAGGKDGGWWSLRPLVAPAVPGAGHPVEVFLGKALAEQGLEFSGEAGRTALVRRLHFALHGLPPQLEDVSAWPADASGGWEGLVDRLLASPRYGERWARHWFDVIHFADSHGFEHDVKRENAWRFRDYVIGAFNGDTPWPRFVREQLAADVFYPEESQLTAALGFLGAGTYDMSAAGTALMSFEYLDRDDLVTQTMSAFASTTANCARCHAHKFDPVSQEDYFALQAVFAGIGKGDLEYDADPQVAAERKRWTALRGAVERRDAGVLLAAGQEEVVASWEAARGGGVVAWTVLRPEVFGAGDGVVLRRLGDESLLASGALPDKDVTVVTAASGVREVSGFRLDLLPDESLPAQGPGRPANGNVHLSEFEVRLFRAGAAEPERLALAEAFSGFSQDSFGLAGSIDGKAETSWAIHPREGQSHAAVFVLSRPLVVEPGDRLQFTLRQLQGGAHLLGRWKLSAAGGARESLTLLPDGVVAALAVPRGERSEAQRLEVAAHVLGEWAAVRLAGLPAPVAVWAAGRAARNERGVITYGEPREIRVLRRGELDKPGVVVKPGALSAVPGLPGRFALADGVPEGLRRAALADWLVDPGNPLSWRSIVNRVWHYHFGRGLCDTPGDFGRMGGEPSHPELLDWLTVWFRDEAKGSLKALHRLIVTSRTWKQASLERSRGLAVDPENRFLWRMNRQRLDADAYRDAVLVVSNRLDPAVGGPGIEHFAKSPGPQSTPKLDYTAYDWTAPGAGRRSIYRVVWRGIADPFMEALDFPELGLTAPVRGFSASPLQSLALLNNEFVLRHSEALGQRAETGGLTAVERVRAMFRQVLLREPDAVELEAMTGLVERHGLAAAARVLINASEFQFLD
ncbi:MAG: PSD1 and planctomycete cytochrome C domain-containing protein [Verrucomicrobiota bacterium]